jgi:uncharacterized protein
MAAPGSTDCLICVFAKSPEAGQVKTRLIPLLGPQGAANFHARCVHRALTTALAAEIGAVELCCAPDCNREFFHQCVQSFGVALTEQGDGDLGARMHVALGRGLAKYQSVLIVGCDCPALTPGDMSAAAAGLREGYDAAFVPAEDGGYVLVGARRTDAALFHGVTWSSAQVMQQTRDNLRALGWRWKELAARWDVDRPEDYNRLRASGLADGLIDFTAQGR